MTGPGKRDRGHRPAWAVASVPKAGAVQLKSGASKEGRRWRCWPSLRPWGSLFSCYSLNEGPLGIKLPLGVSSVMGKATKCTLFPCRLHQEGWSH